MGDPCSLRFVCVRVCVCACLCVLILVLCAAESAVLMCDLLVCCGAGRVEFDHRNHEQTHRAQRCLPKHDQDTLERYAKLTHREASLILAGSGSCVRPLGTLDHGRAMEAKPGGSPRRVGHGIASPKGAAKKEVHTSITGSLDEPSCTANREVQPHPSPTIQYSEWLPTRGQLSCLSCRIMRGRVVN